MRVASPALAQVSPGPLAAPHQELDSTLKCFTCHGKGVSLNERCLACHREIALLVTRGLGLHGLQAKVSCGKCHPDHAGREFKMIQFDEGSPEKFDHAGAGWRLDGKHAPLRCGECHRPQLQKSESARLSQRKDKATLWIGLDRACVSCHADKDVHRGALGPKCENCHAAAAWKPALRFDHSKTDYPLTGRHETVECNTCHLASFLKLPLDKEGRPIPIYKPLAHKECSPCHADPHNGQLGLVCSKCHNTESWTGMNQKKFNHDLTRYPLRGKHAALQCAQCHDPKSAWGKRPPFATCLSCHQDAHAGTATLAGKVVDCAACHTVAGFHPSTYTVEQHAASAYPLLGKHITVKCEACHAKNPPGVAPEKLGKSGVLMRMAHDRCMSCHADAHGGQFAARPGRGACEPCHRVDGWTPSTFTAKDHARLRLGLEGRHAEIECAACHGPARKGLPPLPGPDRIGTAGTALVLTDASCTSCHFDPHDGRFSSRGARPKKNGCLACHDVRTFRPSTVDVAAHATFGFALEGAHRAVPCDACHQESKPAAPRPSLLLLRPATPAMLFALKDSRCEACHKSPHGSQFARRRAGGACVFCHNEDVFKPASRFDHNRDSSYPLEGAHLRVPCAGCHPTRKDPAGRPMVIYQPIPRDCKSCHGNRQPGKLSRLAPFPAGGVFPQPIASRASAERPS